MYKKKYIILGHFCPVIFKGPLIHYDMKYLIGGMRHSTSIHGGITSGGYFIIRDGKVTTGGECFSIPGLQPDPDDAKLLQDFLFGKEGA